MKKTQLRQSLLSHADVDVILSKQSKDDVHKDVWQVLEQVAREDELLARGLCREVAVDSQYIDQLVSGVRKSLKATTSKS